jgi:DNA-binding HxlR family transcriptional regulator
LLTNQLRELERDGLIVRVVFHEIPPKVEYFLSDHGRTLSSVFTDMCGWGFKHIEFMNNTNSLIGNINSESNTQECSTTESTKHVECVIRIYRED